MTDMKAKGVTAGVVQAFVKQTYPQQYDDWIATLSEESQAIFTQPILAVFWYPVIPAIVEPCEKICQMFYNGSQEGARQIGVFSANQSLRGIYKVFVKMGSPKFFLDKASSIAARHYDPPPILEVAQYEKGRAVVHYKCPHFPHWVIEQRVTGFATRGLEISGCKDVRLTTLKSIARGDPYSEVMCVWQI